MDHELLHAAVTGQLVGMVRRASPDDPGRSSDTPVRDRGAVSLEQVLWFVAAGVSVAVVAGLLWSQIRTQANTPVVPPSAP